MNKQIKIIYDREIYSAIASTEKFSKPEFGLENLTFSDSVKVFDKQVGEELIFTSQYIFNTNDLDKILRLHVPSEANAWYDQCKNNILTVRFYKL
jgi:hypothetical protein